MGRPPATARVPEVQGCVRAPCAYQSPRTAYCGTTGEEYTNVSDQMLFSPASDSSNRPLASTPNADFCVSDSSDAIYWLSALNVRPMHSFPVSSRSLIPTRSLSHPQHLT